MKIFKNKKYILFAGVIFGVSMILGFLVMFYYGVFSFGKDINGVDAAGVGLPYQFGGLVTYYQPACASDPITGVCTNCPMCTAFVGNYICNGYQEINFVPVMGSMSPPVVCVIKGFPFLGSTPSPGGQIMGGGASNIMIWTAIAGP